MEEVILVNELDEATGTMEKMEVHRRAMLHRAFSVFVFNSGGALLIHRRASTKYHSAGLWTNTCCSHPRPGESTADAALRRLREEMGFECTLAPAFSFIYRAELEDGLTEHEFDHVFTGIWDGSPSPDPSEVSEWRYVSVETLLDEIASHPETFTAWFRIALPRLIDHTTPLAS